MEIQRASWYSGESSWSCRFDLENIFQFLQGVIFLVGFFFSVDLATKKETIHPRGFLWLWWFSIFMPGNSKQVHNYRKLFSQQKEKQVDFCGNLLPDVWRLKLIFVNVDWTFSILPIFLNKIFLSGEFSFFKVVFLEDVILKAVNPSFLVRTFFFFWEWLVERYCDQKKTFPKNGGLKIFFLTRWSHLHNWAFWIHMSFNSPLFSMLHSGVSWASYPDSVIQIWVGKKLLK